MKFPIFRYGKPLISPRVGNILGVIVSALFVLSALIVHRQLSALEFWISLIFFGGCGYLSLHDLLRSKKTETTAAQRTAEFHKRRQEDPGYFTYIAGGFTFDLEADNRSYQWTDIQSAFACWTTYWDERSSITEITLDVFLDGNNRIRIMESLPGWYQFNKRLSEEISGFPGNWQQTFNSSTSEQNAKLLLYDKKGRTREAAEKEYYQHASNQS